MQGMNGCVYILYVAGKSIRDDWLLVFFSAEICILWVFKGYYGFGLWCGSTHTLSIINTWHNKHCLDYKVVFKALMLVSCSWQVHLTFKRVDGLEQWSRRRNHLSHVKRKSFARNCEIISRRMKSRNRMHNKTFLNNYVAVKCETHLHINLFSALFTSIRRYYVAFLGLAHDELFRTYWIGSNWMFENINIETEQVFDETTMGFQLFLFRHFFLFDDANNAR